MPAPTERPHNDSAVSHGAFMRALDAADHKEPAAQPPPELKKLSPEQLASLKAASEYLTSFNQMCASFASILLAWGLPEETIISCLVHQIAATIRRRQARAERKQLRERTVDMLNRELAVAEVGRGDEFSATLVLGGPGSSGEATS